MRVDVLTLQGNHCWSYSQEQSTHQVLVWARVFGSFRREAWLRSRLSGFPQYVGSLLLRGLATYRCGKVLL